MNLVQYIVRKFEQLQVTDVFGIPGSVILDLIYELDQNEKINIHLNYHEQASAYAACGYAQQAYKLGVAYATKGPGMTNMITAIADAYYDSLPVLFITAHSHRNRIEEMRIETDQELNLLPVVDTITKWAVSIDEIETAVEKIDYACKMATADRKGPVLIDVLVSLFNEEIDEYLKCVNADEKKYYNENKLTGYADYIIEQIKRAKKPILLLGDGVKQSGMSDYAKCFSHNFQIPVLSSRYAQDIMPEDDLYYGYIGSHATRYSNFILAKADLIIALGNRMAYPVTSESFNKALSNSQIVRVDIDQKEFLREIPQAVNISADISLLLPCLANMDNSFVENRDWVRQCNIMKTDLWDCDVDLPTLMIQKLLSLMPEGSTIVCDVGNNELWVSRAYAHNPRKMSIVHSKSFKTVGCALAKAIGVYYASAAPVICFVGDQGIQFNIQELQYISQNQIPIFIVICNNESSGMLRTSERRRGYSHFVHTDFESGYSNPDFERISSAYGIGYTLFADNNFEECTIEQQMPQIIELKIKRDAEIEQYLPKGYPCQNFIPELEEQLYNQIASL